MRGHTGQASSDALDKLHRMQIYLAGQFRKDMSRDEAIAHFGARVVLVRAQNDVLVESGLRPVPMPEIRIRREVEARA